MCITGLFAWGGSNICLRKNASHAYLHIAFVYRVCELWFANHIHTELKYARYIHVKLKYVFHTAGVYVLCVYSHDFLIGGVCCVVCCKLVHIACKNNCLHRVCFTGLIANALTYYFCKGVFVLQAYLHMVELLYLFKVCGLQNLKKNAHIVEICFSN